MKTLIAITAGMLVSFAVTAKPTSTFHQEKMFVTDNFSTKQQALDAGYSIYDSLNTASNQQLRHKLPTFGDNVRGGISVDSAQVKIEEIATSRDTTMYRAVVDIDYSYTARESSTD
ncbi:DUF3316 domain-containing protein [Vibrio sp. HN007]|uniref:DUF3316 domain-containing protein n=1 Tax=Vibrio iocasae TaxID=3098914 RepID=UPI0035D4E7AF